MTDFCEFLDREMRTKAEVRGLKKYKGIYCDVPGHTRGDFAERYTKSGDCVICGGGSSRAQVRDVARTLGKAPKGSSGSREYRMWMGARKRAAEKGLEFTITIDDIVIPEICPVFGRPIVNPSLDRFNNALGYTAENIRVISRRANTMKSDATPQEVLAVASYALGINLAALLLV